MKHLQSKLNFKVWRVYDAIALAVDSIAVSVFALRRAGLSTRDRGWRGKPPVQTCRVSTVAPSSCCHVYIMQQRKMPRQKSPDIDCSQRKVVLKAIAKWWRPNFSSSLFLFRQPTNGQHITMRFLLPIFHFFVVLNMLQLLIRIQLNWKYSQMF